MTTSPWSTPPLRPRSSLLTIMSEQLGEQLQGGGPSQWSLSMALDSTPSPLPTRASEVSETASETPDMADLDLALALQLQEEEAYDLHAFERERPRGLVTTVTRFAPYSLQIQPREPREEAEEDAEASKGPTKRSPPWKVRDKSLKGQGGNGEIITKHDLEKSGLRNARRLEEHVDGCGSLTSPVANGPANALQQKLKRQERYGRVDEESIQTLGKALDNKSRLVLRKLIDSGVLDEVVCVVRTGKEAVVYRGLGPTVIPRNAVGFAPGSSPERDSEVHRVLAANDDDGGEGGDDSEDESGGGLKSRQDSRQTQRELCVKVYRTTLSLFRNRADYVVGDHRFDSLGDLNRLNQQKVVTVWAEKELKNLTRMFRAGIPCPEPIRLHRNVLVMSFIHHEGWGAPRLADLAFSNLKRSAVEEMLVQVVLIARAMLLRCKLVHADLSQFNILYDVHGRCWVIDVGQSVDTSHPGAYDLLALDVKNVCTFFRLHHVGEAVTEAQIVDWIRNGVEEPTVFALASEGATGAKSRWEEYAEELGDWADVAVAVELGSRL